MFVHGGGFVRGDKHMPGSPQYDLVGAWAVRHGYVGVTMTYRLAPGHVWPAGAQDVAAAVGWLQRNIAAYGGDPGKIVVAGNSAGAVHVASYVAGQGGGDPARIAGAALLSGIYQIHQPAPASPSTSTTARTQTRQHPRCRGCSRRRSRCCSASRSATRPASSGKPPAWSAPGSARHGTVPDLVRVEGHNHMSTIASLTVDEPALGTALARFIDRHTSTSGQGDRPVSEPLPTFPPTDTPAPKTGGAQGYLRIATEEAFATPEIIKLWLGLLDDPCFDDPGFRSLWSFYGTATAERPRFILEHLQDLGDKRLKAMDDAGIDRAILSLTSPGAQPLNKDVAREQATLANDRLAEAIRKHPGRFSGLTAVAPQDPEYSAKEIERGKSLGFNGVIINSHTQGEYLDDPKFWPILESAQAQDTPIYLHPNTAPKNFIQPMLDAGLDGAIWGFAVETGTHLLRLITKGVFDRFPNLKLVVGHLGEALPFWLYRLDYMHGATVRSGRYEA